VKKTNNRAVHWDGNFLAKRREKEGEIVGCKKGVQPARAEYSFASGGQGGIRVGGRHFSGVNPCGKGRKRDTI